MTSEEFRSRFGRDPENDDLDRVNCEKAGLRGHKSCGLCQHGLPRFQVCYDCYPKWRNEEWK